MNKPANPSDIARETLRMMAARRIAPDPENYRKCYLEIAGEQDASTAAEQILQQLSAELRAQTNASRLSDELEKTVTDKNWPQFRSVLLTMIASKDDSSAGAPLWAQLILDLMKQWDTRHSELTTARKRESLERVLGGPGSDAVGLASKLRGLVNSWSATAPASSELPELAPLAQAPAPNPATAVRRDGSALPASPPVRTDALAQVRELLAQTLDFAVISQLGHAPDLADEATALAQSAREASGSEALDKLSSSLKKFWYRLEQRGSANAELHQGLLRLLRLLIDNTHDLLSDDQWMSGQVAALKDILGRPLSLSAIADAENRLKEVIFKQGTLRHSLQDAKGALKQLITSFIDRLGHLSDSTGDYHTRLEGYAQTIRQTDDITQLNAVLDNLLKDTRAAQLDTIRTRDELLTARRQVESAEQHVRELESELNKVSELVHEDQLTGVLNRRGLDDAFKRELARAERTGKPLCVSMLDIDNFKHLNDTYGHQTGDDALQHLVRVIKRTMRPSDVLARYGGEEFLLLLPETQQEEAVGVMTRLQRNLTKAFFLHDNDRLLITFSAGVAERAEAEPPTTIIDRADKAMYLAKRSGKNRVCAA